MPAKRNKERPKRATISEKQTKSKILIGVFVV